MTLQVKKGCATALGGKTGAFSKGRKKNKFSEAKPAKRKGGIEESTEVAREKTRKKSDASSEMVDRCGMKRGIKKTSFELAAVKEKKLKKHPSNGPEQDKKEKRDTSPAKA